MVMANFNTVDTEGSSPDVSEVMELLKQAKELFHGFHAKCSKVDTYYYGDNQIDSVDGFDPIHTPKAQSIVNIATDHVDVNNVEIDVPPASARAKARAERLKKFYQGIWMNVKSPVKRDVARHAFAYGIGWFKTAWAADRWPDAPKFEVFERDPDRYREELREFMERRSLVFPFEVDAVNPGRAVWDISKTGPNWFIEYYQTEARTVRAMFPEWTSLPRVNGMVEWVEYWDKDHFAYIADGQLVEGGRHGYGALPYVPVLPSNSMDTNDRPPHQRYRSVLDGTFDLLDEHARVVAAYSAILRNTAWRTIDFIGNEAMAQKARDNYEIFGGMNVVPAGIEVKPSPLVQVPPDLLQQLNLLETMIEEATFPNVIRGVRPRGVSSGFGISVLSGMGRLVFQGVADGMARAVEGCNSNFARMVEKKAGGKVTVHARSVVHNFDQSVGPDDVRGYYENRAVLKAEAPEEREREALLAIRLHQAGVISLYEAQRRAGVTNPLEMQVEQQAELLLQNPMFQQVMAQLAAERVNLLGQAAQMLDAEKDLVNNLGNQFLPGQAQLQRPGEAQIQGERQLNQTAFPQGFGGIDNLGAMLGAAPGGTTAQPNGAQV